MNKNWYWSLMWTFATAPAGISPADESLSTRPTYWNKISSPSSPRKDNLMHMDIKEPVVNVIVCRCTDLCRQAPSRSIGDCRGPYIRWWLSPVPECIQGCRQTPPQLPLPTCYRCWSGYHTSQMVRSSGPAQRLSGKKIKIKFVFPNCNLQVVQQLCQRFWLIGLPQL